MYIYIYNDSLRKSLNKAGYFLTPGVAGSTAPAPPQRQLDVTTLGATYLTGSVVAISLSMFGACEVCGISVCFFFVQYFFFGEIWEI